MLSILNTATQEMIAMMIPVLHVRVLKSRQGKWLAQGLTAHTQASRHSNSSAPDSKGYISPPIRAPLDACLLAHSAAAMTSHTKR